MSNKQVELKYNFIVKEKENKFLYLFYDKPFWFIGDESIQFILKFFSYEINENELNEILINKYKYDGKDEINEIKSSVFELLNSANLFENIQDDAIIDPLAVKDIFAVPVLNITKNCNLACRHCYADAKYTNNYSNNNDLNTEQWEKVIDEIINLVSSRGEDRILITGGEPFLRSDTMDILNYIHNRGFRPLVNTNSLLITESQMESLHKFKAELLVSLDGCTSKAHEYIRGKGTFEKTLNQIKLLKSYDVITRLSFTVHSGNFDEIEGFLSIANKFNIEEIAINNLSFLYRADCNGLKRVSNAKLNNELQRLSQMNDSYLKYISLTDYANLGAILLENMKFLYCGVGAASLCVDSNGDIYPCYNTMCDEFKVGNVLQNSLYDIWNNSDILNKLRGIKIDNMNEKCSKCYVRYYCGGGCRGEAYYATGNILSPYPFCDDNKKTIIEMMFSISENMNVFTNRLFYYRNLKNRFINEFNTNNSKEVLENV